MLKFENSVAMLLGLVVQLDQLRQMRQMGLLRQLVQMLQLKFLLRPKLFHSISK
jgi:signal recognition particle GTPase